MREIQSILFFVHFITATPYWRSSAIYVRTTVTTLLLQGSLTYWCAETSFWGSRQPWYLWLGYVAEQDQTATSWTPNSSRLVTVILNTLCCENSFQREEKVQLTNMTNQVRTTDVCFCNGWKCNSLNIASTSLIIGNTPKANSNMSTPSMILCLYVQNMLQNYLSNYDCMFLQCMRIEYKYTFLKHH